MASVWDELSATATLRQRWIEGVPCLSIARELSSLVGYKVSRNAVIGKAHRLRLNVEFPRPSGFKAKDNQPRACKKRRGPRPANQCPHIHKRAPGTDWVPDEGSAAPRKQAAFHGKTLVERVESGAGVTSPNARPFAQSTGCKWPLRGGMVCCNRIARFGYCAGHDAVAHARTPTVSEEQTARAAAVLTRFDGVIDMNKKSPDIEKTGWDGARFAA